MLQPLWTTMTSSERLITGPDHAPATVLLAHGAGAPMDSPFMEQIAQGLSQRGWRVVRFEFPYMARRRLTGRQAAPDRSPLLLACFREQVAREQSQRPLIIGGKSMGGRIASLVADALPVRGCLCLGYPFHPPGKPAQLRTEHLQTMRTPTLILQGERDSFGRRAEVETYPLANSITVQWLPAGDHSFKPTKQSGLSERDNLETAIAHADRAIAGWCHAS